MMIIYWARKFALINTVIGLQHKYQKIFMLLQKKVTVQAISYKNTMLYVSTPSFFSVTFYWNMFLS